MAISEAIIRSRYNHTIASRIFRDGKFDAQCFGMSFDDNAILVSEKSTHTFHFAYFPMLVCLHKVVEWYLRTGGCDVGNWLVEQCRHEF